MLFSIIIPVYQVEKYIGCALSSVAAQSFADWEAVIVDDGSTDASNAICREYCQSDARFKLIRQDNAGLSAARNTGMDAAAGDYIVFLDGDDFLEPDALEQLAMQIKSEPADIVCFNGYTGFAELPAGHTSREWVRGKDLPFGETLPASRIFDELIRRCPMVSSTPMVWQRCYKRTFLMEHDLRFVSGRLHEDEEWTPRVFFFAASASVIDHSGYCYRRRVGSIMAKLGKKNFEHFALNIVGLCSFFSEHGFGDAETTRPFMRALLIVFSSFVFSALDNGQGDFARELYVKYRIFRKIAELPFYHRLVLREKGYAFLARVALKFPALYRLGAALRRRKTTV